MLLTTPSAVSDWLERGAKTPATVAGVDLRPLAGKFGAAALEGSMFLGCTIDDDLACRMRASKASILDEPVHFAPKLRAFRTSLYSVPDLYAGLAEDGAGWEGTPDYAGFEWFMDTTLRVPKRLPVALSLSAVLHDTLQEALFRAFVHEREVVAIMGGHDVRRQPPQGARDIYWECVGLAKTLTEKGFLIATGGGPGLMEAANLGALLAHKPQAMVDHARALMSNAPYGDKAWRETARDTRALVLGSWDAEVPPAQFSLGMPTWHYGHEPPNMFASHHAKMFYNSLREDGLVTIANSGVVFFAGNAGTVQEIFQDATQNYYLGPGQSPTPMIFFNADGYWDRDPDNVYWPTSRPADRRKPLLPLIRQLALEKDFLKSLLVTDNPAAIVDFLEAVRRLGQPKKADFTMGNALAEKHGNI